MRRAADIRAAAWWILLALPACGALPPERPERGLYLDLQHIVESQERTQRVVDRYEYEARPPANGEQFEHVIRAGARFAVNWDP